LQRTRRVEQVLREQAQRGRQKVRIGRREIDEKVAEGVHGAQRASNRHLVRSGRRRLLLAPAAAVGGGGGGLGLERRRHDGRKGKGKDLVHELARIHTVHESDARHQRRVPPLQHERVAQ
jgi:hypothetical protein